MNKIIPGFWYLENNNLYNKSKTKKYELLSTKFYDLKNNTKNWREVEKIYNQILLELSYNLNRIHLLNWKSSSWEIIIGPWLKKYLAVVTNRVFLIKNKNNLKKKFFFRNFKKNNNLNSRDINDFISKVINDNWNEEIFKRLENYFDSKKNKLSILENKVIYENSNSNKIVIFLKFIVSYVLKIYNFIFSRNSTFVFSRPYFGKKIYFLKLLFKLREFPIIYILDDEKQNFWFDKNLRNKLTFNNSKNLNEKIAKSLLPECLPRIYLEGFNIIQNKIKKSNLPKKKKIIFTSNLRNDSIFKFWLGFQKQKGAKIILAQHGGGYNMFNYDESLSYELKVCDRYLTWGWNNQKNKKIIPFSILNQNIQQDTSASYKKGFSVGMNNFDQYVYSNDPPTILNLIDSEKNLDYRELNALKIFLNGLNQDIKNKIVIRPHPSKLRKHTTKKFEQDFNKKFKFNRNYRISGEKFLENFQLNIFTQLQSTTTIFSLAKNFPSLIICPHDLKYFNIETKKIILLLKKANIFHSSPKNAYKFLNKIYKDPNRWWKQKKTQAARIEFCNMHGKCSNKQFLTKLTNVLLKEKKNFIRI